MSHLISKVGLDNGYNRRISVELFGDIAEVKALPAKDGYPEVVGRAGNDGASFVLAETSPEAVSMYANLRANRHTLLDSFSLAFKPYFIADHDAADFIAAASAFESSASYAEVVAAANEALNENAAKKAADSAAEAAKKAQAAATASQAAADAATSHANDLAAQASTGD